MIKTITLSFVAATFLLAQNQPGEAAQASKPEAGRTRLESIPAAATQAGSNLYRYTDASGKTWLYSRTPFGVSKREEKPVKQPVVRDSQLMTVTDLGDSVRFERTTPFGITTWVSKKSELTDGEQAMLLREQFKNQSGLGEAGLAPAQGKK